MKRAGAAIAVVVVALGLAGCIKVDRVKVADQAGFTSLADVFGDDADLTCVHEPAPPWQFDTLGFTALAGSFADYGIAKAHCPQVRGLWRRGRWVNSYETVVLRLKDCEVIGVRSVAIRDGFPLDSSPVDFCTTPDRLVVGPAPEPRLMNVLRSSR